MQNPGAFLSFPRLPALSVLWVVAVAPSFVLGDVHFRTFSKSSTDTAIRIAKFITTHYDSSRVDSILVGGGSLGDPRMDAMPKHGQPFNDDLRPAYNHYHQQTTSGTAVRISSPADDTLTYDMDADTLAVNPAGDSIPDAVNRFVNKYRATVKSSASYGSPPPYIDILNYGNYSDSGYFLKDDHRNVQVLNNVMIGKSCLLTITFPPKWTKLGYDSSGSLYPIVLHGNGFGVENNNQIYEHLDLQDATNAALTYEQLTNCKGVISIYVNSGGRESLGLNSNLLDTLQYFFRTFMPSYGGDTNRVLTKGGSRGGAEAVAWGVLENGMHTRSILASVPPVKLGKITQFSAASYPALGGAAMTILGSDDAWKDDYAGLTRTRKAKAISRIVLGTDTAWSLDSADSRSLWGSLAKANTDSLKNKFIHFATGTHDAFFPLPYFLQMDSMLSRRGIGHANLYAYVMGHNVEIHYPHFQSEMKRLDLAAGPGPFTGQTRRFIVPKKIEFDFANGKVKNPSQDSTQVWWMTDPTVDTILKYRPGYFTDGVDHDPAELGFSATVPYTVIRNLPFEIVVSGDSGKPWKLWARLEKGYDKKFEARGRFGVPDSTVITPAGSITKEEGAEFTILKNVSYSELNDVEWFFEYDGKEVPNRFTPWVSSQYDSTGEGLSVSPSNYFLRTVSYIKNSESDLARYEDYFRYNQFSSLGNGVDQIHTLLFEANDTSFFNSIPNQSIDTSIVDTAVFSIPYFCANCTGADSLRFDVDKDTLRFDLRKKNGDYIPGGILNPKSGWFRVPTAGLTVGVDTLRASLSDGKGGTAYKDFQLTVTP